jgi:hypothetical protein
MANDQKHLLVIVRSTASQACGEAEHGIAGHAIMDPARRTTLLGIGRRTNSVPTGHGGGNAQTRSRRPPRAMSVNGTWQTSVAALSMSAVEGKAEILDLPAVSVNDLTRISTECTIISP